MYLAAGYVGLVMKNPGVAAKLRTRFMRRDESYEAIFSDKTPLHTWVAITGILKRSEELLQLVRPTSGGENFMKGWRNLVAFLTVARTFGKFSYSIPDLIRFEPESITAASIAEIWGLIQSEMGSFKNRVGRKRSFVAACCARAACDFGIVDIAAVGKRSLPIDEPRTKHVRHSLMQRTSAMTPQFLDQVDAALPAQPWKPGVHRQVAAAVGCQPGDVSTAIGRLIALGRRSQQRDGIVYAEDGSVLSIDADRMPGS